MIIVDNFKKIESLLDFTTPGFYLVQILQRRKENPTMKTNAYVIHTYYIRRLEHLKSLMLEIKHLCRLYNARAYINLNKKNQDKLALPMIKKLLDNVEQNEFSNIHRIFESVAASSTFSKEKIWIVDLDGESYNEEIRGDIIKFINSLPPVSDKFITTIKTVNGYHLITKPFNTSMFANKYQNIDIHKNNPTLLFYPGDGFNMTKFIE